MTDVSFPFTPDIASCVLHSNGLYFGLACTQEQQFIREWFSTETCLQTSSLGTETLTIRQNEGCKSFIRDVDPNILEEDLFPTEYSLNLDCTETKAYIIECSAGCSSYDSLSLCRSGACSWRGSACVSDCYEYVSLQVDRAISESHGTIRTDHTVESTLYCQELCLDDSECVAYEFANSISSADNCFTYSEGRIISYVESNSQLEYRVCVEQALPTPAPTVTSQIHTLCSATDNQDICVLSYCTWENSDCLYCSICDKREVISREGVDYEGIGYESYASCEQSCFGRTACEMFEYNPASKKCFLYADFRETTDSTTSSVVGYCRVNSPCISTGLDYDSGGIVRQLVSTDTEEEDTEELEIGSTVLVAVAALCALLLIGCMIILWKQRSDFFSSDETESLKRHPGRAAMGRGMAPGRRKRIPGKGRDDEEDSDSYFGTAPSNKFLDKIKQRNEVDLTPQENDKKMTLVYSQIDQEVEISEVARTAGEKPVLRMAKMDQFVRAAHAERSNSSRSRPVGDQSTARSHSRDVHRMPGRPFKSSQTPNTETYDGDDALQRHQVALNMIQLEKEKNQFGKRGFKLSTHVDTTPVRPAFDSRDDQLPMHQDSFHTPWALQTSIE